MRQATLFYAAGALCAAAGLAVALLGLPDRKTARILARCQPERACGGVTVEAPFDDTVFPRDMAAPLFKWRTDAKAADTWVLRFASDPGAKPLSFVTAIPLRARSIPTRVTLSVRTRFTIAAISDAGSVSLTRKRIPGGW